jgi:hypothetical protein
MIIIIFNLRAILMLLGGWVVGAAVGLGVTLITADSRLGLGLGALWGMGVVAVSDLWYRATHDAHRGLVRFFWPTSGGMLYYIPLWVLMGAVPLFGLVWATARKQGWLPPIRQRPAPATRFRSSTHHDRLGVQREAVCHRHFLVLGKTFLSHTSFSYIVPRRPARSQRAAGGSWRDPC